jgi:hypothetical protein
VRLPDFFCPLALAQIKQDKDGDEAISLSQPTLQIVQKTPGRLIVIISAPLIFFSRRAALSAPLIFDIDNTVRYL